MNEKRLGLLFWLPCLALLACAEGKPDKKAEPLEVIVEFSTSQGQAVAGGRVHLDGQDTMSDASGSVHLAALPSESMRVLSASCPSTHVGKKTERKISPLVVGSGTPLRVDVICEPLEQKLALAVQSGCPEVEITVGDRVVGTTTDGLLHTVFREPLGADDWAGGVHIVPVRAKSLDPNCELSEDHAAEQRSETVLPVEFDRGTLAIWASFAGRSRPRVSVGRKGPARRPHRPYRL